MDESSGSRTILRTLFVALWFVLGAVFAGWQLSQGTLTDAVRKVAHIEDTKGADDSGDGISFGGETHQLSLGGDGSDEEDAEAAEADDESLDQGDEQATEDIDDESVEEADAGESVEGDLQSDEPEEPQYEAAANSGAADEDDEDDDHVGIGDNE